MIDHVSDTLTILRARNRRLAKLIHPDSRIDGYDSARTFDMTKHPVSGLDDIRAALVSLLPRWDCAVVRGAVLDPTRTHGVRRLLHPDVDTGEAPTLQDVPRRWLALDMEGISYRATHDSSDLTGCAQLAIATLPSAFRGVRCIVQASGSHGFKSDLRLRLWFWCNRAVSGTELKRWLRNTPADPSVFRAAQLIYTAAPVMAGGAADPLPCRLAELPGKPTLPVPDPDTLSPPPRPGAIGDRALANAEAASRYARGALVRAAMSIARAAKRHPVIVSECRGLARLVAAGLLTEAELSAVIRRAAHKAGKDDEAEIESCIAWGLAHPSQGKVPEARNG